MRLWISAQKGKFNIFLFFGLTVTKIKSHCIVLLCQQHDLPSLETFFHGWGGYMKAAFWI